MYAEEIGCSVNVRKQSDLSGEVCNVLDFAEMVTVVERRGNWVRNERSGDGR